MTDAEALALCAFQEANLEPDDGVAAVVRVVLNRTARGYQSDGSIQGTVFHPAAFSWTRYEMAEGHYVKVAFTSKDVTDRAVRLLGQAKAYNGRWARCAEIVGRVEAGAYAGALYDRITPDVLLYDNLALARPAWATPDKLVVEIGRHSFFTA